MSVPNNYFTILLQKIPPAVNTYEALGRAFVLTPRVDVFKNLNKVNTDTEQKITTLEVIIVHQFENNKIKY